MFVTFHLSISFCCRCRSEIRVWGLLPGFVSHCTVRDFRECFGKSLYGRNLLLTIQNLFLLLPRDIRFSTNEGVKMFARRIANMQKVLEVRVCCCACVYGESLLTSGERGIQKTTNSFCFGTIRLDALLQQ